MMETLNDLYRLVDPESGEEEPIADAQLRAFIQVLAPYAPFTAEACWPKVGGQGSVHRSSWPEYDPDLELEELLTIAIQVNGKLRGTLDVSHDAAEPEIRRQAEALESVARFLRQGEVVKVIYVRGQIMNFVVRA